MPDGFIQKSISMEGFEVKSSEEEKGIIEGYAATFGNIDRHGDIIAPGTFKGGRSKVPIFALHRPELAIGVGYVQEDEKGLKIKMKLAVDSDSDTLRERAREYYALVKEGIIEKMSVGMIIQDREWQERAIDGKKVPVRVIKKADLVEVSLVPIPANDKAQITSVKDWDHPDLERIIEAAVQKALTAKAASGAMDLPLADREREWDANAAVARVKAWAGGPNKEDIDWAKYRRAFFWYDSENPENFGSYKLPFADVINGQLMAVPRAIFAAAAAIQGARGGVNIPESDVAAVKRKIESYYKKMRSKFNDESIVAPWKQNKTLQNLDLSALIASRLGLF